VTQVSELIGGAGGLGWVAVKAVLLFAVAVIGLRLGERRTLAQLSAFDFAVAVAVGAIIGRGATHRTRRSLPRRSRWSPSWWRIASSRSFAGTAGSSA
jgi:hypothetical protein